MLGFKRGVVLVSGALVLSACEFIAITPDRVDEGAGGMITVSEVFTDGEECVDEEVTVSYIDPDGGGLVELGTVMAGAPGEDWSIEVPAPTERGSYLIVAECETTSSVFPEELIVQPAFAPTVDPSSYVVGEGPDVITVTGDFCISSSFLEGGPVVPFAEHEEEPLPPEVPLPTVVGILGAEELTAEASELQPFDETWTLEFTAPTTPGTHTIDIGCSYLDFVSGSFPGDLLAEDPFVLSTGVSALDSHEPELPPFIDEAVAAALVSVQVDGLLELDDDAVDEGDSVTVTNADNSPCDGAVAVQLLDGETVVDSAAPAVTDGAWSVTFEDLAEGAYTVVAECTGTEDAGTFSYEGAVLSVAGVQPTTTTTTTTTTVPGGGVASDSATPVRAQPSFTG